MGTVGITKREQLKPKPTDESTLGFGQLFTDYMLKMEYDVETGWSVPQIIPYGPMTMDPANVALHYGQLIFEGLKAYKTPENEVVMFRPDANIARLNRSAKKLHMPEIDPESYLAALAQLIDLEREWIPTGKESSLYIRPFMFASENFLGVRPSNNYVFLTILSPVGSYYAEGLAPTKIYVEDKYVRAVKGGVGEAKCAGNYAASLSASAEAAEKGYSQVLWLDGAQRKFIEEVGTSNVFFVVDDKVITPQLNGSILPGITRDSAIKLLKEKGISVEEREISIDELVEHHEQGRLKEAFASGTAAVVSPIGELGYKDRKLVINNGEIGKVSQLVYDTLTGIQKGRLEDKFGWVYPVNKS